jgi:hypothetical protein
MKDFNSSYDIDHYNNFGYTNFEQKHYLNLNINFNK